MPAMTGTLSLSLSLCLLLAALAVQTHAHTLRLGKPAPSSSLSSSSSHRFPEDVYAQPAFRVRLDGSTVNNSTAYGIVNAVGEVDAAVPHDSQPPPRTHSVIMHSAPSIAHLCTLSPPLRSRTADNDANDSLALTPANLLSQRHRVIRTGLTLLAPLKGQCLYYTSDWFTYSLCLGEAVRQFRALPNTIGIGKVPAQDPSQHAFVLGRWREDLEVVGGQVYNQYTPRAGDDDEHVLRDLTTALGISTQEATSTSLTSTSAHRVSDLLDNQDDDNGTELMEVITFDDGHGDDKQRYLSQVWSDGTLCDINNEPRTIEVQYHCNGALTSSQITLIKETTTCHYVLVVETPLVCKEPLLRGSAGASASHHEQQRRKKVGEWKCSRIVDDRVDGEEQSQGEELHQGEYVDGDTQPDQPQQDEHTHTETGATPLEEAKHYALDSDAVAVEELNVDEAEALDGLHDENEGAGVEGVEGLLGDLLHGGGGVVGGAVEIQLNGRDIQQLLAGGDENANDIQSALARIVEGELSKLGGEGAQQEGEESESESESERERTPDDETAQRLERLRSRLSSITDALMQARDGADNGNGNANANDRDGSSSIFSELNRAARGEEGKEPSSPPPSQDGKAPGKPTFHGPAAPAQPKPVDTLADRAQRFYDDRRRRREKEKERNQVVKDEL